MPIEKLTMKMSDAASTISDLLSKNQDLLAAVIEPLVKIMHDAEFVDAECRKYRVWYEDLSRKCIALEAREQSQDAEIISLALNLRASEDRYGNLIRDLRQADATSSVAHLRMKEVLSRHSGAPIVSIVEPENQQRVTDQR